MIQHSDSTAMAQRQQRHEQAMNELNRLQSENDDLRAEVEELREYRRLAYRDPLTGLRNRRYLDERMREEMQRARRHTNPTFSVLLFDLNDFKRINDEHGHAVGDECLRFIARFLEDNLRDHDVCCRTGGDEFTAILPESDAAGAELLVARLRASLARVARSRRRLRRRLRL